MGPLGVQEVVFIFLLALLLFGPKKLPELARMMGKAVNEFRRAQADMKATFDRELRNLERETEALKQPDRGYQPPDYNYDYSNAVSTYDAYDPDPEPDLIAAESSTNGASATEGADSQPAAIPEGAIAHGSEPIAAEHPAEQHPAEPVPAASGVSQADHSA